jgi:hypothetical protein
LRTRAAKLLVNTATIDSDQTVKDDDTANVLVQVVLAATATPVATLPPTDTIDSGDQARAKLASPDARPACPRRVGLVVGHYPDAWSHLPEEVRRR